MLVNSTSNNNIKSQNKTDSINHQHPLVNLQSKRLSIIDRGKSWAKQLIKSNKLSNSPSLTAHKSFDSCDSGIDINSSSSYSSSNCSKISTSSSCSFITSYISNNSDTATSKSSNSSSLLSGNGDSYDQVYSSPSNSSSSKASSSAYLISPIDESGYLVPIINFPIKTNNNNHQSNRSKLKNSNSSSHLARSFSTRSAYNANTNSNNQTNSSNTTSSSNNSNNKSFVPNNRATICEQMTTSDSINGLLVDYCIKCNSKLNKLDCKNESLLLAFSKTKEENLIKTNQAYHLFDSFTCASCLLSATDTNKSLPNAPPPPPPLPTSRPPKQLSIPENPPPPLPTQPPPSLLNYTNTNTSNIKITPLLICTSQNNQIIIKETKILTTQKNFNNKNNSKITQSDSSSSSSSNPSSTSSNQSNICCNCNFCILNLNYLNSTLTNSSSTSTGTTTTVALPITASNCIDCLNLNKIRSSTPELDSELIDKSNLNLSNINNKSGNNKVEPIIYIDSQEDNLDLNSSTYKTMNQLLIKLKQRNSSYFLNNENSKNNNCKACSLISPLTSLSQHGIVNNNNECPTDLINNKNNLKQQRVNKRDLAVNHDYHLIDDENRQNLKNLTPSNSVESFEFLNLNSNINKQDTTSINYYISSNNSSSSNNNKAVITPPIASYEKSWENSTIILLNNLQEKLNKPNLIPVQQITPQSRVQNQQPVINCREKRSSSFALHNSNRILFTEHNNDQSSFNISNNNNNKNNNNNPSSVSSRNSIKNIQSIVTTNKTNDKQQQLLLLDNNNNNSDDIEHLLTTSTHEKDAVSSCIPTLRSLNLDKCSIGNSESDLTLDYESLNEPWYQPNLPRENVLDYLIERDIGSFVIRLSNSCKNCFALSIRVPYFANQHGIAHYLITRNSKGYKLKGVEKEFKSLKSLVTHYSVMQEILPVTLNLSNNQISSQTKVNMNTNGKNCVINQINQSFLNQHNLKNVSCLIK